MTQRKTLRDFLGTGLGVFAPLYNPLLADEIPAWVAEERAEITAQQQAEWSRDDETEEQGDARRWREADANNPPEADEPTICGPLYVRTGSGKGVRYAEYRATDEISGWDDRARFRRVVGANGRKRYVLAG